MSERKTEKYDRFNPDGIPSGEVKTQYTEEELRE